MLKEILEIPFDVVAECRLMVGKNLGFYLVVEELVGD